MTKDDRITCSLCAWRGTCAKKFSISAKDLLHCIDYTRDLTIRDRPEVIEDESKDESAADTEKEEE